MSLPTILIMAGGTGGHIMPGLAIAHELRKRGWNVVWLGHPNRMEGKIVPSHGFVLEAMHFSGLRGKGVLALLKLPFTLLSACWQAMRIYNKTKPDVVLGMGGYVAFPGGLVSALRRVPLVVHEQNAVAGTANKWLARIAKKTITGFPGVIPGAVVLGNPVREELNNLMPVKQRYNEHGGALRILIIGGSLGASVLNSVVPKAIGLMAPGQRPQIWHQSGEQHIEALNEAYKEHDVVARTQAFIDNMAAAYEWADLVICRAGAMTVSEVAAAGVAALFIPLPHAIDDHQTANAKYLADCDGAWLRKQPEFTAEWLAQWLSELNRNHLLSIATHAQQHAMRDATQLIADACEHASGRSA